MNLHDTRNDATEESAAAHVIPSVTLSGSRSDRLRTLDALIQQLLRTRRGLAGDVVDRGGFEGPSRLAGEPSWPWFAAGTLLGAIFVLLLLVARGCSGV